MSCKSININSINIRGTTFVKIYTFDFFSNTYALRKNYNFLKKIYKKKNKQYTFGLIITHKIINLDIKIIENDTKNHWIWSYLLLIPKRQFGQIGSLRSWSWSCLLNCFCKFLKLFSSFYILSFASCNYNKYCKSYEDLKVFCIIWAGQATQKNSSTFFLNNKKILHVR